LKAPLFGLVFVIVFEGFDLSLGLAQANEAAQVFKPALASIRGQTQIPILLPTKLPSVIRVGDIKLAFGEVRGNGYWISLYYAELGSDGTYAAGFSGSRDAFAGLPNTRQVVLANGLVGTFRAVSCGGSCAPANLWWEQNGVTYQIQIKLLSTMSENEQERTLVETANSTVPVEQQ
jgi:hypothetical protein